MNRNQHNRHAALARPAYGHFHRNEWAIIGTPCGNIRRLAFDLIGRLSEMYRFGYADADHTAPVPGEAQSALTHGAGVEYTDKIAHHRFDLGGKLDKFQYRRCFNDVDAVLVNGNHFPAERQIVIVDPKKEDSLRRKLDRLTDVRLILLTDGVEEIYPFLRDHLPAAAEVPVMKLDDTARIAEWLQEQMAHLRPPIYGLVLAGGKSERMGRDKGLIDYHGRPQREHAAALLINFCERVYLSCRPDQAEQISGELPLLPDTFTGLGPLGAILTAFRAYPDAAWLVVATDLPLLDQTTLAQLVAKRNISKMATAFRSPVNDFPEPLIALWEPRGYPVLLQFLSQGYNCPRKALINSDIELVEAANPDALMNVNHPEELEAIMARLGKV